MKTIWLQDFLMLVELGSFSKAAQACHVTQPAFSRRIKALENWLGVDLVDREVFPLRLTQAGQAFIEQAEILLNQVQHMRTTMQGFKQERLELSIALQQSLAVSFFPDWLQNVQALTQGAFIRICADDFPDAIDDFLARSYDFLLCYSSPDLFKRLEGEHLLSLDIGKDRLIPVSTPKIAALFEMDHSNVSLRLLNFPESTFFGRLIRRDCLAYLPDALVVEDVYESALAEGLKALVLKGMGVAWLPESLVREEIKAQQLVQINQGLRSTSLQIKLYQYPPAQTQQAQQFWNYLEELYNESAMIH